MMDEILKDPVCGMEIKEKNEKLSVVFSKMTYYFCCNHCKIQFLQNPEKYAKKENDAENKNYY